MANPLSVFKSEHQKCGFDNIKCICFAGDAGQQVERFILYLGHDSYKNSSHLAQVVPGPVEPYSAEWWPKTAIISFSFVHIAVRI